MTTFDEKVAVVVLNWNRRDMLLDCLNHIRKLNYSVYQIIVVDNASTDGSVEAVRANFPDVDLIVNKTNLGAIEGKNTGLRKALKSPVEYIYMVDNDIVADSESLRELVHVAENDGNVGLVGTIMYDHSKPDTILSAGGIIDFTQNVSRGRGVNKKDKGQFNRVEDVDFLWGGALLARRAVLEEVGLFDPGYIGYWFEDTDLSMRVKKAGYKILFCPYAKIWHKPHANIEEFSYRKKYLATRNAIRFMKKYATPMNWVKYIFFAVGGIPYAFFRDLILHGSGMGAIGKARGFIEGLLQKEDAAKNLLNEEQEKSEACS